MSDRSFLGPARSEPLLDLGFAFQVRIAVDAASVAAHMAMARRAYLGKTVQPVLLDARDERLKLHLILGKHVLAG